MSGNGKDAGVRPDGTGGHFVTCVPFLVERDAWGLALLGGGPGSLEYLFAEVDGFYAEEFGGLA
jgi:hypothetical protein